jgi:hypothetical protein
MFVWVQNCQYVNTVTFLKNASISGSSSVSPENDVNPS